MNNISLIGDCHSSRILRSHLIFNNTFDFTVWSKGGLKLGYDSYTGFDPSILYNKNSLSDNIERPVNDDYLKNYSIEFSKIKDEGVILVWIGYVDIKNKLPITNNSYEIINKSIINLKKFFKNSTILFIEPFPQFYKFHSPKNENHIEYSFEERIKQNDIFIKNLNVLLKKHNLPSPISQQEIIDCTGIKIFDESVMKPSGVSENGILLYERDAIFQKYYNLIYKLFIKKAIEVVN